jgi:hypothetical protein
MPVNQLDELVQHMKAIAALLERSGR